MPDRELQTRPRLDTALRNLAAESRRRVLIELLEDDPQDPVDVQLPTDGRHRDIASNEIAMVHSHLPKLDDAEFVEWDRDANTVERGPRFDEIRPLLELLQDHADELPYDEF